MYKFIGLAMIGVFAMMILPGNFDTTQSEQLIYGMATMVKNDSLGNEAFQQTVHNALTDEGEDYILEAIFDDGVTADASNLSMGAICVGLNSYDNATSREDATASSFDTTDGLTTSNCKQEVATEVITNVSIATIGPLTFTAGAGNVNDDDTIQAIGICQNQSADDNDFANCVAGGGGSGELLAVVNVTPTTLASGETVDITYTFSLVSNIT